MHNRHGERHLRRSTVAFRVIVPDTRYVKSGDGYLACQVFGEGPVDLIFQSAWGSHVEEVWRMPGGFAGLLQGLASFCRVIVFDLRGTGLSDPVAIADMTSLERWMEETQVVLDAVGSHQAALLGHGGGGQLFALFAATHPDRSKALVMWRTAARFTTAGDYPWGLAPERVPDYLEQIEREWGNGAQLARTLQVRGPDPELRRRLARYERYVAGPATYKAAMRMVLNSDIRGILSTVKVPTLVAHQAGDRFTPVGHSRYLAEQITGARYVEVPPILEDPASVASVIAEFVTGAPSVIPSDRVLATVLFTDIVGSTRRVADVGDRRWHETLDYYDEAAADVLREFRGQPVKSTGDGTFATFDGPARAIRCAVALSEAVERLGLEMRSGLHTGEVETRGEDVAGIAVHIGQRISALAEPGEILVSRTVKDLVAGSGLTLIDRGSVGLKGIDDEWQVYAVVRPRVTA